MSSNQTTNLGLNQWEGSDRFTRAEMNADNKKIDDAFATVVNKEAGKGLSSEDYSSEEKTKLAGVDEGANNYAHPISHPASMIVTNELMRFITDALLSKLNNISENANDYTHPSSHPASMITTTEAMRFITDALLEKLNGVEDNANNYVHPSSHSASMITTSASMRFITDVLLSKLNGIESGATGDQTASEIVALVRNQLVDLGLNSLVGGAKILSKGNYGLPSQTSTSSTITAASYTDKVMSCTNTSAIVKTVPANQFKAGDIAYFMKTNGAVNFAAGSGMTLRSPDDTKRSIKNKYQMVSLYFISPVEAVLTGVFE